MKVEYEPLNDPNCGLVFNKENFPGIQAHKLVFISGEGEVRIIADDDPIPAGGVVEKVYEEGKPIVDKKVWQNLDQGVHHVGYYFYNHDHQGDRLFNGVPYSLEPADGGIK